jgi:hypothetical protein
MFVTLLAANGCGGDDAPSGSGGATSSGGTGNDGGTGSSEPPADVAGDYTVALTNRENTCPDNADWTEGSMNVGVPFSITQMGTKVEAETMGESAIYFLLLTGSNKFVGDVQGSHFVLTNYGTTMKSYGDCPYTLNVVVEGDLDGDTIAGTVSYVPDLGNNPDCAEYECSALQSFNGTRPPE